MKSIFTVSPAFHRAETSDLPSWTTRTHRSHFTDKNLVFKAYIGRLHLNVGCKTCGVGNRHPSHLCHRIQMWLVWSTHIRRHLDGHHVNFCAILSAGNVGDPNQKHGVTLQVCNCASLCFAGWNWFDSCATLWIGTFNIGYYSSWICSSSTLLRRHKKFPVDSHPLLSQSSNNELQTRPWFYQSRLVSWTSCRPVDHSYWNTAQER